MATITKKSLGAANSGADAGCDRPGVVPWSLAQLSNGLGSGAAVPSNGYDQKTIVPITAVNGDPRGVILTDNTAEAATNSVHPNNAHANSGVDNAIGGPVDIRVQTTTGGKNADGPANTGQGADVATFGSSTPAAPTTTPGYSINGE